MKNGRVLFLVLIMFLTSFSSFAGSLNYEFSNLILKEDNYSVRKHLKKALDYSRRGMNDNFISELNVLLQIDPKRYVYYSAMINKTKGPSYLFVEMAKMDKAAPEILSLIQEAAAEYRESRTDRAGSILKEALKTDPSCRGASMFLKEIAEEEFFGSINELFLSEARVLYNKGLEYYRKGFYDNALVLFTEAFNHDPVNPSIRRFIKLSSKIDSASDSHASAAGASAAARKYEASENIEKAREYYETAALLGDKEAAAKLNEFSSKSEALAQEAAKLLAEGKVQEAYLKNIEALSYNPDNKEAAANAAELAKSLPPEAAAALLESVAKKALAEGDTDKARMLYEKAAEMGSASAADTLAGLDSKSDELAAQAEELLKQGRVKEAYMLNMQALELNPENKKALANSEALKPLVPDSVSVNLIYNQGVDFYLKKDYVRAIESWNNVLVLSPNDAQTKDSMTKAKVKLAAQIKADKAAAEAALSEGIEFMKEGLMDKAVNRFEYAIRLVPENTSAALKLKQALKLLDVQYDKDAIIKR